MLTKLFSLLFLFLLLVVMPPVFSAEPEDLPESRGRAVSFSGNISWYGKQFHGKRTASGEIFDMNKCTSAHRKLPFFTRFLVEDPRSGDTVIVKVNDRGPFAGGRVMDVSREAAKRLEFIGRGTAYVDCTVLPQRRAIAAK
ncbi:MAG: septal ring lytic transglycosylase RlpA family protein [Candidatus Obscuribacterales bacterium]|nr:septal ring lytic transglycosylase RlpA family protein [Candidatus Obscuribacterales bacterium]